MTKLSLKRAAIEMVLSMALHRQTANSTSIFLTALVPRPPRET